MHPNRREVLMHIEPVVAENLATLTRNPESNWQPSDYTPDLSTEEGMAAVRGLQETARALPDDLLIVLVGDMITEEALPTYATWIAQIEGPDRAGEPRNAWGDWNRAWCGEENRHGDLLNRYLYLTGRVNMREVEVSIQHLIRDGGNTQNENDPYRTFVYTSYQEIATRISHLNVGLEARKTGAEDLYKICSKIAGDEHRHARAYKMFFQEILKHDPNEALLAFQDMMKKKITMPSMYMRERGLEVGDTFAKLGVLMERTGVYTLDHYLEILDQLVEDWGIAHLSGLDGAGRKAQDYLCNLSGRLRKVSERFKKPKSDEVIHVTWLDQAPAITS